MPLQASAVVFLALCTSLAGARSGAEAQPPARRESAGLVVGQVMDAATGKGLDRVRVTISGIEQTSSSSTGPSTPFRHTVIATKDGRYVFRNLPAGRYSISASRSGFHESGLGTRRPGGPRQILALADGERVTTRAILLWRHASLSGTVLDDLGEPIVGLRVRALRRTPARGRDFGGEPSGVTDDRGLYRIGEMPPGDYIVVVPSIVREASLLHVLTFHPSATIPQQAAIVTLAPGDERTGVDVQLSRAKGMRVAGTIEGPDGPAADVSVRLRWPDPEGFPFDLEVATTVSGPDGGFAFEHVSEGTYLIEATRKPAPVVVSRTTPVGFEYGSGVTTSTSWMDTAPSAEPTLIASAALAVGDRDVHDLTLTLRSGARVSGRIVFDGAARLPPDVVKRTSVWLDRVDERLSRAQPAMPDQFGAFKSEALPPGRYRLRVGVVPTGWTFESAMFDGRDISDEPFDLESSDVSGVAVTLTARGTTLSGAVRTAQGTPDPETSVLLFPIAPSAWPNASIFRMRSVRPSTAGSYSITNLRPGEYFVVAIREEDAQGWQDPERLAELAPRATRVRIVEGQSHVQDLRTVRDR